jgi:hypothetical protein
MPSRRVRALDCSHPHSPFASNDELNLALSFRPGAASLEYEKHLSDGESS